MPHLPSGIAPTGHPGPAVNHQVIRRRLRVPAIGLIVTGIISCSSIIFATGVWLLKSRVGGPFGFLPGAMAIIALVSAPAILIIIAGSKMLRLRSYGLAVAGSIIALVPCHLAFPVGLIFGIWSLAVLSGIDVQAAFSRSG